MNTLKKTIFMLLFLISLMFVYACNNNHVFIFESNGGSSVNGYILSQGDTVGEPVPPSRSGYFFDGWYEDDITFNNPYVFPGSMPDHNVTVYAKWSFCNCVANAPDLADGLTPIYWDNNNNLIRHGTSLWDDSLWYDYSDTSNALNTSRWANAVSDDGSYWVWIPRFVYRISYNWHNYNEGIIDVCFVDGNDDSSVSVALTNLDMATDSDMKWTSHSAFAFGDYELNGIWVAKFEATVDKDDIQILPGVASVTSSIDTAFNWTIKMTNDGNPYGFKSEQVNVHLMKQQDWGAIAYLSHSIYGRNQIEITPNTSNLYTGGASSTGWLSNGSQSTSGNTYGVFDMSGGKSEYVSSYVGNPDLSWNNQCDTLNSLYCTKYDDDVHNTINYKGDAIYETSDFVDINASWFNHRSVYPTHDDTWFIRGGSHDPSSNPGIFAYDKLTTFLEASYRPVLIVYPKVEPIVTLTFNSLGVDVLINSVVVGSTIYDPGITNQSNPSCTLLSWYYDANFTNQAYLPFVMPNQDLTLYAKWSCLYNCDRVNGPELFTGMNPLYYNVSGEEIRKYTNVTSQTINPLWVESEWYDYIDTSQPNMQNQSKWANAVSMDGSYWVWIPRFVYTITSGWHQSTAGTIDVCFVFGTQDSATGHTLVNTGAASDSNGTWTSHPAFTFGSNELSGFWIAKFEASNHNGEVLITHGVESWRSIPLNTIFTTARQMETKTSHYGWLTSEVDSHQTKNEEWGAVAYLAHSKFGLNDNEIGHHGNGYWTGGGQPNDYINNGHLSTTGNPHGVYDMRGGGMELVAAYNASANITNNTCVTTGAPYCTAYSNTHMWGINSKGDALYETGAGISYNYGWFGSYTFWPLVQTPWFHRGGYSGGISNSGLFFFDGNYQYAYPQPDHYDRFTFRPVLIKK